MPAAKTPIASTEGAPDHKARKIVWVHTPLWNHASPIKRSEHGVQANQSGAFATLLESIRVTSSEKDLINTELSQDLGQIASQDGPETSSQRSTKRSRHHEVPDESEVETSIEPSFELSRAPDWIVDEFASIEQAWKRWDWDGTR